MTQTDARTSPTPRPPRRRASGTAWIGAVTGVISFGIVVYNFWHDSLRPAHVIVEPADALDVFYGQDGNLGFLVETSIRNVGGRTGFIGKQRISCSAKDPTERFSLYETFSGEPSANGITVKAVPSTLSVKAGEDVSHFAEYLSEHAWRDGHTLSAKPYSCDVEADVGGETAPRKLATFSFKLSDEDVAEINASPQGDVRYVFTAESGIGSIRP